MALALGLDGGKGGELNRMDTNSKLQATIEEALRESWEKKTKREEAEMNKVKDGDSKGDKTRRLSNLYGMSPLSPHVVKRSSSTNSLHSQHSSKGLKTINKTLPAAFEEWTEDSNSAYSGKSGSGAGKSSVSHSTHSGSAPSNNEDGGMSEPPLSPQNAQVTKMGKSSSMNHLQTVSGTAADFLDDTDLLSRLKEHRWDVHHDHNKRHGWYCGYSNRAQDYLPMPAGHMRYGKAGALRMRHRAMHMLALSDPRLVDWQRRDWTPSLSGSPHIWEDDANYVSGSTLKDEPTFEEPCDRITRGLEKDLLERRRQEEEVVAEMKEAGRIQVELGNTQANRMANPPKVNQITSFQKNLHYWDNFTIITKDKDTAESVKLAAEKDLLDKKVREESKWERLVVLYNIMRLPGFRTASLRDVQTIYLEFMKVGSKNDNPRTVNREQFLSVLFSIYGRELKSRDMNRLYSSFDISKTDSIDFREFIACLRILRMATERPVEKLNALFPLFDLDDENFILFPDLVKLLQTCSISADEKKLMLNHARGMLGLEEEGAGGVTKKRSQIAWESNLKITREQYSKQIRRNALLHDFHAQMLARLPENLREEITRSSKTMHDTGLAMISP
jgi:Ca2+-binding EF-hand superfamily protein